MTTNELTPELKAALSQFDVPQVSDRFYAELEARVVQSNPPVQDRKYVQFRYVLPPLMTAAAAIVVVALVNSSMFSTNTDRSPQIASPTITQRPVSGFHPMLAAQVVAQAETTYSTTSGVSGSATSIEYCASTVVGNDPNATETCDVDHPRTHVTKFRFDNAGNSWQMPVSNSEPDSDSLVLPTAYDAKTNTEFSETTVDANGRKLTAPQIQSTTTEDPRFNGNNYVFGEFSFTSLLRGLSVDKNAALQDGMYMGRPVWSIHARGLSTDLFGFSPDEVIAQFDKTTLFPVSVEERRYGKEFLLTTVNYLDVNARFTAGDFTLSPAKGQTMIIKTEPNPWTVLNSAGEIATKITYRPLLPTWLPDGYKLAQMAVAQDAGQSGAEGMNPYNRDVVELIYRRGLQRLVVTTRLVGSDSKSWIDPYGLEGEGNAKSSEVKVVGGVYNGTTAQLVTGFGVTPHVWVVGATLVSAVYGDATSDELESIVGSLQRQ